MKRIALFCGDIIVLYISLLLTLFIRYGAVTTELWHQHFASFTFIYALWLIVFYIDGLYSLVLARNNLTFYTTLFRGLAINAGLAISLFYFIPQFGITPKTNLFLNLGIFAILCIIWRQFYNHIAKSTTLIDNVLIIGKNKEARQIVRMTRKNPQLGFHIVKNIRPKDIHTPFDLLELVTSQNIKLIITAIDPHNDTKLVKSLYQCLPLKIAFSDLPSFYEKVLGKVPISSIGEVWFLENLTERQKNFYEALKRIFVDVLGALIGGIISLPFFPLIALAIKLDSRGPVFYTQRRIGLDGRIFKVIKFRSMIDQAERGGIQWARKDDGRITRVGRFMRKTRIDETPQFWNILVGQMSFIGPRAERIEFVQRLEKEIPYYQIRHIVKPGLTGWAQVNFHYGASVADSIDKLQYELYYIKHRSFILDLGIILRTIKIVITGAGQ